MKTLVEARNVREKDSDVSDEERRIVRLTKEGDNTNTLPHAISPHKMFERCLVRL